MKEVVVVTTKPHTNEAEYGIRDTATGQWLIHGVVIPVPIDVLTVEQQTALGVARQIILDLALADAVDKGLV